MSVPYYADESVTVWHGDCLHVMAAMPDNSVDAIVTDPPYGLGFMGKAWDDLPPGLPWAQECLRVLKPGGHLLAFGGTRTWHRLAVAVEDAGFEIRDSIAWLHSQGFPKSLDVGKAIDKAAGVAFSVRPASGVGFVAPNGPNGYNVTKNQLTREGESTSEAQQWQGWGTALKPAFEPVVVARKPLAGTVAANVLAHGTGALNVDACRIGDGGQLKWERPRGMGYHGGDDAGRVAATENAAGRWPTNVVLDDTAAAELDEQSGEIRSSGHRNRSESAEMTPAGEFMGAMRGRAIPGVNTYNDSGGASRFFPTFRYEPKAPTAERPRDGDTAHPTVKPLDLMRWLVRLVTPPGGLVLDPFAGSGTTGEACIVEGARAVLIEREADHLPLIVARLSKPIQPDLFGLDA